MYNVLIDNNTLPPSIHDFSIMVAMDRQQNIKAILRRLVTKGKAKTWELLLVLIGLL